MLVDVVREVEIANMRTHKQRGIHTSFQLKIYQIQSEDFRLCPRSEGRLSANLQPIIVAEVLVLISLDFAFQNRKISLDPWHPSLGRWKRWENYMEDSENLFLSIRLV